MKNLGPVFFSIKLMLNHVTEVQNYKLSLQISLICVGFYVSYHTLALILCHKGALSVNFSVLAALQSWVYYFVPTKSHSSDLILNQ